jgi:hypothetical protein
MLLAFALAAKAGVYLFHTWLDLRQYAMMQPSVAFPEALRSTLQQIDKVARRVDPVLTWLSA